MNIRLSLSIACSAVLLLLTGSCNKSRNPGNDAAINDAEISYWYNNKLHNYNFSNIILQNVTIRQLLVYNGDTPYYYYSATFPFSSEKTISDLQLLLYNNTLYPGQEFYPGAWTGPYEEYYPGYFTSNSLTAMIRRPGGTRYYAPYFYADRSFRFTIDSLVGGKASGRFEGNLFFYENNVKADSIELQQGVFRNIPVLEL